MLCEICGKEEATIQLTSTGKKHKTEQWICKNCASEHFYFQDDQMSDQNLDQEFVVNQFLQYLVGKHGINFKQVQPQEEKHCPTCGMTLTDMLKLVSLVVMTAMKLLKMMYRKLLEEFKRAVGSIQVKYLYLQEVKYNSNNKLLRKKKYYKA